MNTYSSSLDFVCCVWTAIAQRATGKQIMGMCVKLFAERKYDLPDDEPRGAAGSSKDTRRHYDNLRAYSGTFAETRRLGLMSSVATALVSTWPESSLELQRRISLRLLVSDARGWSWNDPPVSVEYLSGQTIGNHWEDEYMYFRLVEGRYDNRHPYGFNPPTHAWPGGRKPSIWRTLWSLTHSSGDHEQGLDAYESLLGERDEVIAKGFAPAIAQNYCECLIDPDDPIRTDRTALHETVRFCALYCALRLAHPGVSRYEAEKALDYPNRRFGNHWSIAVTLSRLEQDYLS